MITYEAVYDPESENVYSVSLVENPAMESMFITLKKQDNVIQLAEVDKKERTLLGIMNGFFLWSGPFESHDE